MIPASHFRAWCATAASLISLLATSPATASDTLWKQLATGGKVVLMRHGSLNQGRGSGNSLVRDPSCEKERNLSDAGKREAEAIGEHFRRLGIPVSDVRHSPFCRTTDTARIAFERGAPADYLSLLEILGADAAAAQTEQLKQIIGSHAGTGNLILITHEPNINAVSFEMLKPADFLVLQPLGGSAYEELGVVSLKPDAS